jgi:hypothetical protein
MATPTTTALLSLTTSTALPECTTAVPDRYGYVPEDACNAQWAYSPSFSAAVALAALFGLLTVSHTISAFIHRKGFCWVIIMAATWETVGFSLRAVAAHNQQSEGLAFGSQIFFLLAPLWINAFVYMTAGRLIYTFHPAKAIWGIKAISFGKWFVWLDIFSFGVQATGGMMLNPTNSASIQDIAKKIYLTGIGVQEFFILLYLSLVVKFHIEARAMERQGVLPNPTGRRGSMWKWLTYALYAVLALISMRIVFRLFEFSGGMDPSKNKLPFVEGYALGLDAVPMLLALLVLAVVHPGLVLRGEESEFPSRKVRKAERKEKKKAKKEEKRVRKEEREMRKQGDL